MSQIPSVGCTAICAWEPCQCHFPPVGQSSSACRTLVFAPCSCPESTCQDPIAWSACNSNIYPSIVCAGLVISYWGGKYMALRRAQKPSALGDEVTGAINLLVRLLPLVQMILMYHLFFQVWKLLFPSRSALSCINGPHAPPLLPGLETFFPSRSALSCIKGPHVPPLLLSLRSAMSNIVMSCSLAQKRIHLRR